MRRIKTILFILLLLLATWLRCDVIHDAALAGDLGKAKEPLAGGHFVVTPAEIGSALDSTVACTRAETRSCGN